MIFLFGFVAKFILFPQNIFLFLKKCTDMTTADIRQKLTTYLEYADEKKLKAIYVMVEDEINTEENNWDENFIEELKLRSKQFKNGTTKTYSWEETKSAAKK